MEATPCRGRTFESLGHLKLVSNCILTIRVETFQMNPRTALMPLFSFPGLLAILNGGRSQLTVLKGNNLG